MPCNEVIKSNNVLIKDNNHSTFSFGRKGKFIPEIPGENVLYPQIYLCLYPGKKIPRPGPTRNKITRPDPTRPHPKIFFKMFPDSGPVSARSGPVRGNSGFRVAPQVFSYRQLPEFRYSRGSSSRTIIYFQPILEAFSPDSHTFFRLSSLVSFRSAVIHPCT